MEIPGFQESAFHGLHEPQPKISRRVFDRKTALEQAPPHIQQIYKELFRQIDTIELMVNFYELEVGKRVKEPRDVLLRRFTEEEITQIRGRAKDLTQYKYLKLRHLLVELRTQQYDYYDLYCGRITPHGESIMNVGQEEPLGVDADVDVLPLGLKYDDPLSSKIFSAAGPEDYTAEELERVNQLIWRPRNNAAIDFRNEKHILSLYETREDLREDAARDTTNIYGVPSQILDTLHFYESLADLTKPQQDILDLKLRHKTNAQIADYINKKYNKNYNDNYISTIFHQRIIVAIAQAARLHEETIRNIFYPENFKRCKDCGRVLLLTTDNFVKQKKSNDGFSPRCKKCEKLKRERKKNEANR